MSRMLAGWMTVMTVFAVASSGCGNDGDRGETGAPSAGPTTTTEPAASDIVGLDFVNGSEVDLGGGWILEPCESGPPLFCARHGGETQAVIELRSAPVASYSSMKKELDAGRSPIDALRAEAAEFVSVFEKDRPEGCGASYTITPFGPETVTVAGAPGIVYGFDGEQDGRHVERALLYSTIDGATAHLIGVTAIDDGSCMDDGELFEFTIDELTDLEPKLMRVIAASTLS
jgi:hypothetical protein